MGILRPLEKSAGMTFGRDIVTHGDFLRHGHHGMAMAQTSLRRAVS